MTKAESNLFLWFPSDKLISTEVIFSISVIINDKIFENGLEPSSLVAYTSFEGRFFSGLPTWYLLVTCQILIGLKWGWRWIHEISLSQILHACLPRIFWFSLDSRPLILKVDFSFLTFLWLNRFLFIFFGSCRRMLSFLIPVLIGKWAGNGF